MRGLKAGASGPRRDGHLNCKFRHEVILSIGQLIRRGISIHLKAVSLGGGLIGGPASVDVPLHLTHDEDPSVCKRHWSPDTQPMAVSNSGT